jgi:chromosome segregation ATPase
MKSNTKSWIILLISIIAVIILSKVYFGQGMKDLRDANNKLKDSINVVQVQRDSLKSERILIDRKNDSLQKGIDKREDEIKFLDTKLYKIQHDLNSAKHNLSKYKSEFDSVKMKIDLLQKNPVKRSGEGLLNSLRENIK